MYMVIMGLIVEIKRKALRLSPASVLLGERSATDKIEEHANDILLKAYHCQRLSLSVRLIHVAMRSQQVSLWKQQVNLGLMVLKDMLTFVALPVLTVDLKGDWVYVFWNQTTAFFIDIVVGMVI